MNEQLQLALTQLLQSVLQAKDFLIVELPDVVQQLLVYKAVFSLLSMIGFVLLLWLIVWANLKQIAYWRKKLSEPYETWTDCPELLCNGFQAFLIFPLGNLWSTDWLVIWLAPKVYLIEYAASLAK